MKNNRGLRYLAFVLLIFVCCFSRAIAQTKVANDPTRISVGARTLGMGKAFVGIANDASAVYINPAGLGGQEGWKLTSMSSKFINEVNYLSLSSLYGTKFGAFAVSYVGSSLGFVTPSTTIESVDGIYRVIQITGESDSYSYNNNVMLFSYGTKIERLWGMGQIDNLFAGASLKLFSQGIAGKNIVGGIASGYDLDVGFLYLPSSWISVGFVVQDVLPRELGGKLVWPVSANRATAVEEDIPAVGKLGGAFKVIGIGSPYQFGEHELVWAIDAEYAAGKTGVPILYHTGLEWWPVPVAALRLGIDQDFVGSGGGVFSVSNNLTAGVGIFYQGFSFDYAYHQYNNLSQNDTNYFSLSFALLPPGLRAKEKETKVLMPAANMLLIEKPETINQVFYDSQMTIAGKILDPRVFKLEVGRIKKEVAGLATFEAKAQLGFGKNLVQIKAYNEVGWEIEKIDLKALRLNSFVDVDNDYFAKEPISYLSALGIISGYPGGRFLPEGTLTRAELATLLVKAKGIVPKPVQSAPFADVAAQHWAAPYIKAAVDEGYVLGYPDGTFRPKNSINRVEGILVIARFAGQKETANLIEGPFPDLPGRHWAAKMVDAAKKAGLLEYLSNKILKPTQELSRGEAAEIISRTPQIAKELKPLRDFEKGYEQKNQAPVYSLQIYKPDKALGKE